MPRKSSSFWRLFKEAQAKLDKKEEMLEKRANEKEAGKISMDAVEKLLNGKDTIFVQS